MGQEGLKFYRCNSCGNLFLVMIDPCVTPSCCGTEMQQLDHTRHSHEGSESHLPIISLHEDYTEVRVGLQLHPMDSQHRIEWVVLTDGKRIEVQKLGLTTNPIVRFSKMDDSGKLRAYAFCNIHGLWESEK